MERPNIPPWSVERTMLDTANHVFTVVFGIEMYLKVIIIMIDIFKLDKNNIRTGQTNFSR